MAMTNCPECGRSISTKAMTCPHCGYPLPEDAPFRKPPNPIDPAWTERYDAAIRKRKTGLWIGFVASLLLFALFLCLCLLDKRVTHLWGGDTYSTKEEWLALSCVFGAFTLILFGFAVGVSARLKACHETMYGYTVLVYLGLLVASLVTENRPTEIVFRRTFFRRGFHAKLPDDTEYYVRYHGGEVEFSYNPFDDDSSGSDKYTYGT